MNLVKTVEKEQIGVAWWVEIFTSNPYCTYYFGPFESRKEAILEQPGYIEDLVDEGALLIAVEIKWCKPRNLTISSNNKLAESSNCGVAQP